MIFGRLSRQIHTSQTNQLLLNLPKRSMSSSNIKPIVELREYALHPSHVVQYTQATTEAAELRKSLTPLRLFSMPETGGQLNVATHLYYFHGFEERNSKRSAMSKSAEWKQYLKKVKPCMISQTSTIFVEAPLVSEMDGICGLDPDANATSILNAGDTDNVAEDSIFEIRRYQLKLGYDTVPKFLKLYKEGLPSKLNAEGTDTTTALVTLLYSDVGQLNEVIEVWRHGSTDAMERSRVAARSAQEWRNSIEKIAELATVFTNTIHKPLSFSPLR